MRIQAINNNKYFQRTHINNQNNKKIFNELNSKNDIFFGANFETTKLKDNTFLIHSTNFLREEESDALLRDVILSDYKDKNINIAVGACSSGEEVYTLSILLDSIKDRVKITGFDIDENSIKRAKRGKYSIQTSDSRSSVNLLDGNDSFLVEDRGNLTPLQQEFKSVFHTKFNALDENFIVKKNKLTRGEKFANLINRKIGIDKKNRFPLYDKYKRFEAKADAFENCKFKQGNILDIDKYFDNESVDILFFRNALYHLVCKNDQFSRKMNPDAEDVIRSIAKKGNAIIKPNGYFVFGENEFLQGVDTKLIYKIMQEEGFKPFNTEHVLNDGALHNMDKDTLEALSTNIWQKSN